MQFFVFYKTRILFKLTYLYKNSILSLNYICLQLKRYLYAVNKTNNMNEHILVFNIQNLFFLFKLVNQHEKWVKANLDRLEVIKIHTINTFNQLVLL